MTLVSTTRAAEISGLTQARIRQLCAAGTIEAQRIGRDWLIAERDAAKIVRQQPGPKPKDSKGKALRQRK